MAAYDLTAIGSPLTVDTDPNSSGEGVSCIKIDDTHFLAFWGRYVGNNGYGCAQVFTVNPTTKAVTAEGSVTTFNGGYLKQVSYFSSAKIDDTHFIAFYSGIDQDGYVGVFTVNPSTWAVTVTTTTELWNNTSIYSTACAQIDSNHFIVFWGDTEATYGRSQVVEVNTSTWAVTSKSTASFSDRRIQMCSCTKIDSTHFVNFYCDYYNGSPRYGYANIFEVDTSTWAITVGTRFTFLATGADWNSCFMVDSNHVINFWSGSGGAQVFTLNVSDNTISANGSALSDSHTYNSCCKLDDNHFIRFWGYSSGGGAVYEVNLSDYSVSRVGAAVSKSTSQFGFNSCVLVSDNYALDFWQGNDEYAQVFQAALPGPSNLKTFNGLEKVSIKTINGLTMGSIKSINGLT